MSQPVMRQPIPVGKYFVDRGKITPEQLELALQHRQQFGLKLGQSLVELGLVSEADMVEALRHQARFPCIHLTTGIVEPGTASALGEEHSRNLRAVVLNRIANHATVAMEDPNDVQALEELARLLDGKVFPVYAEATAIRAAIDHVFGRSASEPPKRRIPVQTAPAQPAAAIALDASGEDIVCGFLENARAAGASDVHLEAREQDLLVRFRVDGTLHEHATVPRARSQEILERVRAFAHLDPAQRHLPQEGHVQLRIGEERLDLRVATTPSLHGESALLHVIGHDGVERGLDELDLSQDAHLHLDRYLSGRDGLALVTGPAGSGKTATLYALLRGSVAPAVKAVTLENPIEQRVSGAIQIRLDPASGLSAAAGLRSALQQDPDVLMVGELADAATARGLLEAALAGRKVLAALRAHGAAEALARFVDLGVERFLLADALRLVVVQRLVRRLCPHCKTPVALDEALLDRLGLGGPAALDATFHEGEGCEICNGTGYRGRIALHEVVAVTSGLRLAIARGADSEALERAVQAEGLARLRDDGLHKARAGLTTLHEVLAATSQV